MRRIAQEADRGNAVIKEIFCAIRCHLKNAPGIQIFPFGSYATGLGDYMADLDLCVWFGEPPTSKAEADAHLRRLQTFLQDLPLIKAMKYMRWPKVPFLDIQWQVNSPEIAVREVQISANSQSGIYNSHLIRGYVNFDTRVKPIITSFKLFGKRSGIINSQRCRLSSFAATLMGIHFLQTKNVLPNLQAVRPDIYTMSKQPNELFTPEDLQLPKFTNTNSAELFIDLLDYFAKFEYDKFAISINRRRVSRTLLEHQSAPVLILDPYDEQANVARALPKGGDFGTTLEQTFSSAVQLLKEKPDLGQIGLHEQ